MEVRPGYKQTEVGIIPADWDCAQIANVARLESGHTPSKRKPTYWNGSVQWVSLHDTAALDDQEIALTAKTITEDGLKHSSARLLPPGTVVFSRTATVGKATILATSMATSQDFANYICGPDLHNRYLVYLFRSMGPIWQRLMAGSIHNTIYMPVFKALKIVLPPIAEQRAIAAALSDVDALLDGLERLIAKKRDLKQAAMQQLLTGQTRLPGFSGEWSKINVAKHAKLNARIGWQALTTEEYLKNGTHFLVTGTDFVDGRVNWATCHYVDEWRYNQDRNIQLKNCDVLLTKDGTIGKVGYVDGLPGPATLNSGVFVIRPVQEAFVPLFLFYVLASQIFDDFLAMITAGSTIVHLYQKDFVGFEFLAPDTEEQAAIATILSDMDAELAALEARRDKTRALKQGMMQELLTGKTRLL